MSNEKFKVKFGLAVGDTVATVDGTTGDIVTSGDIAVNGGDITTTSTTANVVNTTATTVNIAGAGTTVSIGANTGTTTVNNSLVADDISVTTVDTTNLEVTNIKAKDGTAAAVIADSTGIITVSTQLNVDNLNLSGNTISSTDTNGNITLDPNGTGNVVMTFANGGNLTNDRNYVSGVIRQTAAASAGDVYGFGTGTTTPYRGISLDNYATATTTTGKRTGIVLRNFGAPPRNTVIGEVARGSNPSTPLTPLSGISLMEMVGGGYYGGGTGDGWTSSTTSGRTGTVSLYTTENWSSTNTGTGFTVATTPTGAYAGTIQTVFDVNSNTASIISDAQTFKTKPVASGGTNFTMLNLTESLVTVGGDLRINGGDIQASDGNTNITLNSNTLTTFAGDIRINGGDIQASDGNTNITMTSNTLTSFAGDIKVAGGDIQASDGNTNITMTSNTLTSFAGDIKVNGQNLNGPTGTFFNIVSDDHFNISSPNFAHFNKTPTSNSGVSIHPGGDADNTGSLIYTSTNTSDGTKFSRSTWNTFRTTDGINYTPTQNNDNLGSFGFNGNYNTSTTLSSGSTGAQIFVYATENWTSTANGTAMNFNVIKAGTTTGYDVIKANPVSTEFKADSFTFNETSGSQITGNKINYNRVYGQWQYDATISPVAANTAYAYPIAGASGVTDFANIASVGSTSRIIPGAAGMYKLQFSVQLDNSDNGNDHTAYFWWRKNGTDVPASMGQIRVVKNGATVAGWDNMISSANSTDYWELMYAVSDTRVTLPYYSATAFGPAAASMFITLVPVGA